MRNKESDDELDCIYKISKQRKEWVKSMEDRRISRGYAKSYITDSDEEDEQWHYRLKGVTMLHCNMVIKSLYCARAQDRKLPMYHGLTITDEFLTKFEITVPEHQWFDALRQVLRTTPM